MMTEEQRNTPRWLAAVRDESKSTSTTEYVAGDEILGRVVLYSKMYQSSLTAYVWPGRPTVQMQSFAKWEWDEAKRWVERTIADAL